MRSVVGAVSFCLMVAPSITAFAGDKETKQACVSAYENAQIAMKRAQLKRAHGELAACLNEACPQALRSDCAMWLKEVEGREPTVVFSYVDDLGKSRRDVRVSVGGVSLSSELDGRGHAIDPGEIVVTFEPVGKKAHEIRFVVREGQKLQLVEYREPLRAVAPVPATPDTKTTPEPSRVPLYVGLGTLGLGLAGFGGFGAWGLSGKSSLESCKPFCSEDEASSVRTRFIAADISLAVATVGAVVTVVSIITSQSRNSRSTTTASAPLHARTP